MEKRLPPNTAEGSTADPDAITFLTSIPTALPLAYSALKSRNHQECPCLRAFALATASGWNAHSQSPTQLILFKSLVTGHTYPKLYFIPTHIQMHTLSPSLCPSSLLLFFHSIHKSADIHTFYLFLCLLCACPQHTPPENVSTKRARTLWLTCSLLCPQSLERSCLDRQYPFVPRIKMLNADNL